MGKKKPGRPVWFKILLSQRPIIDSVPDEVAGRALKAALRYFDTRESEKLDPLANVIFASFRNNVDISFEEYNNSVKFGEIGAGARKKKEGG